MKEKSNLHHKNNDAKYHFLFDNLQETVVIYEMVRDSNGRIIDWKLDDCNNLAKQELGRSFEEAKGKSATELFGEDIMAEYLELSRRIDETRVVESFETYFEHNEKYYSSKAFFITEDLYVNASKDVTEQKKIEREKEKLQDQLFQAQKMESVGRLAGGIAHDFNNMLSVILGNTELLIDQIDPSHSFYEFLEEIENGALKAAAITQQLLAFARKQTISPKTLDLNETVGSMLKMLKRLISEEIELRWLPGDKISPVLMDPSQIDQILANLCVNAKDAIEGVGNITIETGEVCFDEAYCKRNRGFLPGNFVMLAVSDNGCGIEKEIQNKIFEPFYTTKKPDKGTGLGLATVYGIIKQNRGFINIYSEPDQGTTVKIYFPSQRGAQTEQIETSVEFSKGDEIILLVEDDLSILEMSTRILESLGYTVIPANSPSEALFLARNSSEIVDLLMTDVIMPEMNGKELSEKIKSVYPDIKCLYMSGYTANVIAHHGVLDEDVKFIAKPFLKKNLAVKLREVLD